MYWVCHWPFFVVCDALLLGMKWAQTGKQRHDLLRNFRVDTFNIVVHFISSPVRYGGVALTENFVQLTFWYYYLVVSRYNVALPYSPTFLLDSVDILL